MTTAAHQHQLELFVSRHRGWRIANASSWEIFARASHEVAGESWELRLQVDEGRSLVTDCWVAQFTSAAGRVGATYRGDYDEVAEAMDRVDRVFRALQELKGMRTSTAARDFLVQFPKRDIRVMEQILDIRKAGSWAGVLEATIIRICGHEFRIRVDQWRMAYV